MWSFGRAVLRWAVWAAVMLLVGEGAVRAVALVLRRDTTVAARAGGRVVYCVGDSFTYGQGVRTDEAWPQVLGRLLEVAMPGRAPQVRTLAEPGRSSSVAVVDVRTALQAGDAGLVLVLTGWNANDGDFAEHASHHQRAVPWTSTLDLWLERSRLYRVAKQALTFRSRTLVVDDVRIVPQSTAMSLYDFHAYQEIGLENLRQIARMCRAAKVPCAFLTYPHQLLPPSGATTRTEFYHAFFGSTPLSESDYLFHDRLPGEIAMDAVIRHVAESEGLPLIDTQPAFDRASGQSLFLADYHHPTAVGHALIARTVFEAVATGLAAAGRDVERRTVPSVADVRGTGRGAAIVARRTRVAGGDAAEVRRPERRAGEPGTAGHPAAAIQPSTPTARAADAVDRSR